MRCFYGTRWTNHEQIFRLVSIISKLKCLFYFSLVSVASCMYAIHNYVTFWHSTKVSHPHFGCEIVVKLSNNNINELHIIYSTHIEKYVLNRRSLLSTVAIARWIYIMMTNWATKALKIRIPHFRKFLSIWAVMYCFFVFFVFFFFFSILFCLFLSRSVNTQVTRNKTSTKNKIKPNACS